MPNGRTGGFLIPREDLKEALRAVADGAVSSPTATPPIGQRLAAKVWVEVDVREAMALAEGFPGSQIWVEEHDHDVNPLYIIHLDLEVQEVGKTDVEKWIAVSTSSPLFEALRRLAKG